MAAAAAPSQQHASTAWAAPKGCSRVQHHQDPGWAAARSRHTRGTKPAARGCSCQAVLQSSHKQGATSERRWLCRSSSSTAQSSSRGRAVPAVQQPALGQGRRGASPVPAARSCSWRKPSGRSRLPGRASSGALHSNHILHCLPSQRETMKWSWRCREEDSCQPGEAAQGGSSSSTLGAAGHPRSFSHCAACRKEHEKTAAGKIAKL